MEPFYIYHPIVTTFEASSSHLKSQQSLRVIDLMAIVVEMGAPSISPSAISRGLKVRKEDFQGQWGGGFHPDRFLTEKSFCFANFQL
jgi:hypothetical protein